MYRGRPSGPHPSYEFLPHHGHVARYLSSPPVGGCSRCSASCEICKERCPRYDEFILEICISTPVARRARNGVHRARVNFWWDCTDVNSIQLYSVTWLRARFYDVTDDVPPWVVDFRTVVEFARVYARIKVTRTFSWISKGCIYIFKRDKIIYFEVILCFFISLIFSTSRESKELFVRSLFDDREDLMRLRFLW